MKRKLKESPKILNQISKSLKDLKDKFINKEKGDSKFTPGIARVYGMKIDHKIKSLGRSGISKISVEDKLDSIIKMLMGVGGKEFQKYGRFLMGLLLKIHGSATE